MSVAFRNLSVHAFGRRTDYQRTVANFLSASVANWVTKNPKYRIDILHELDGVVPSGEMLLVLGNPGSGCTTMLKSLAGQTYDVCIDEEAAINYQGLSSKQMFTEFRGKGTYQAEFDIHFPSLTMRETLEFAYRARRPPKYWDVTQATVESDVRALGLSKALDTKMGNAYVPGVSGGERKRTSIAEILLGDSVFQCWDNSTRGLDSANARDFVKALRRRTTENRSVAIVTLYQAGEEIYDLFDKVTVLYEGRQIYFGPTKDARKYFTDMGYIPPERSTTPEFLTSVTRPLDLRPQTRDAIGWLPRTAEDFEQRWKTSHQYKALINEIDTYNAIYPLGDEKNLRAMRRELKGFEERR
ncbi:ABC transporter CDR4 [Daldinia childiae]|uniref:ABC transporter CDR4 n=1 Tax=Daldinia childiae TaxID=326645 RepID=UPI001447A793|nr:ABC transporter CDR4 [Daldinia childiae]KAF3058605.1 ABC transporter CDR4 [Daldinia childiae]